MKLAKIFGYNDMVKDLYNGCCSIVEGARELGLEVGTWIQCLEFPYRKPKVDFVTASPSTEEVLNVKPDINKWTKYYEICSENNTNLILIFDFADRDNLPLPVFSQKLTPQEQSEFLEKLYKMKETIKSANANVDFSIAYPVHGVGLGKNPKKLAWGKYKLYDAKAPEFDTYNTIKRIMSKCVSVNTKKQVRVPSVSFLTLLMAFFLAFYARNRR